MTDQKDQDQKQDRNAQVEVTTGQTTKILRPVLSVEDAMYWVRRINTLVPSARAQAVVRAW